MITAKGGQKMSVVEVVPIVRGGLKTSLSYFSVLTLEVGEIVKISVRNSKAVAIVSGVQSAHSIKSELRRGDFALRKIARADVLNAHLPTAFVRAARRAALFYATTTGNVLSNLIPKFLLAEPDLFFSGEKKMANGGISKETMVVQMETEERFAQYNALVRQNFARNNSVMFVVPTYQDALRAFDILAKGISEFTYLFTLEKKKKELKETWQKACTSTHPILFITTTAGIIFDRQDLETIILERENSRAYRTFSRPFIQTKIFLEYLTRESKKQLVLGDSVLSIETLWREKEGEHRELTPIRWHLPAAPTTIVDMKKDKEQEKFEILSPELKDMINKAVEQKKGILLFGARKGLAPLTICGDCGQTLACQNCGSPVVLHANGTYVCHTCGALRSPKTLCDYCRSWNLKTLGIGLELIAQEVKKLFSRNQVKVHILDKDHAPTEREAKSIINNFTEEGGILIGTELAFLYVDKIPYTALVSADALFSIPDYGIHERIFYLVSHLREISEREVIIQTRNIGKEVLTWATAGNILDFYTSEINDRRALSYPPFAIFIKIVGKRISDIKDRFGKWKPDMVKDSLIIRLAREKWPDPELSSLLSLLTPDFLIKVDPESIL